MNKISQKEAQALSFHYMAGADPLQYELLMSIANPVEKLGFISKESPSAGCLMDDSSGEIFWRPKLGKVFVSADTLFKRYPTAPGAYKEAMRIKGLMIFKIKTLKKSYQNRFFNHRIINQHYSPINN